MRRNKDNDGSLAAFETRLAMEVTQIPKRVLSAIFKADIFVAPRLIVSSLLNDHCPYTHPFLLLHFTAHRFLSRPTAFYHCPPLPITSFHCPPLPITSFHCPPLPISAYRFQSLFTATYHCPPLPITAHRFLSLPTAYYHSPPRPITC